MGYNIEWADTDVTECWSYNGRLYQSKSKADYQRASQQEYRDSYSRNNPEKDIPSWWNTLPPVYKITWIWEEV